MLFIYYTILLLYEVLFTFTLSVVLLIRTLIFRWTIGLRFLVIYENANNPYLITHLCYLLMEAKLQRWESCLSSLFSSLSFTFCVVYLWYECIGLLLPEDIGMRVFFSETNMIKHVYWKLSVFRWNCERHKILGITWKTSS